MIRILYMSDLHLEMERWRLAVPGWAAFLAGRRAIATHPTRGPLLSGPLLNGARPADLIVLAGDIHNGLRGIVYADQLAKFLRAPVVYVAGNHEFYHHDITQLYPALHRAAAHTQGRVRFLENTTASFTFSGQRLHVLGCTLWTDYALHGDAASGMAAAARLLNDHVMIQNQGGPLPPAGLLSRHRESRFWLHAELARLHAADPAAQTLIVTHHAPTGAVLGTRTGAIAPAYASELLGEFTPHAPAAWIHGHTHFRHDSAAHNIRLASAPRGYVSRDGRAALDYQPGMLEIWPRGAESPAPVFDR